MAAPTVNTATPPAESLSYEQAIAELEAIIERIEQGEIGLQDSLAAYHRGAALLRRCTGILDAAQQQVEILAAGAPGAQTVD